MFSNQTCLITGGTGSWGTALVKRLLQYEPRELRIFSRNEFAQVEMQRAFQSDPRLHFIIGDVRDERAVSRACQGVDYVFHLAALKHVPVCEQHPEEALKTNVIGTENVIHASIAAGVKKVVDVSTDKAVNPINFYGMTKALGEQLMIQANHQSDKTRFVCIRGGNVLGTNGSVVPLFRKQILETGSITLTSRQMTRFFLTLADAIELLVQAAIVAHGGETFVMKMHTCRIEDLALVMGRALSDVPIQVREIGIRPGEKLHEVLVSHYESKRTVQYGQKYYVVLPQHGDLQLEYLYQACPNVSFDSYSSNADLMSEAEIEALLQQGGFLP